LTDTHTMRLPWPEAALHPHARVGRRKVMAAERMARAHAYAAFERINARVSHDAHIRVIFYPPDRRGRDTTNLIAAIKSYVDGIAAAGAVDHSAWSYLIQRGQMIPHGCVIIAVTGERPPPT